MQAHGAQPPDQPARTPTAEHPLPPETPARKRRTRRAQTRSPWTTILRDLVVAAVPVAAGAVSGVVGVAAIPWLWLMLASGAVAAIAVCVEHALTARQLAARSRWLAIGLIVALSLPAGAFAYHQWFDPAARTPQKYYFVVNGGEANELRLSGEPGGEPQVLVQPLFGGQTYPFECWTAAPDGTAWLRLAGAQWYVPRAYLHPPSGIRQGRVPPC